MSNGAKWVGCSVVALAVMLLVAVPVVSQEKGNVEPPGAEHAAKAEKEMAEWQMVNQKGPEHAHFAKMAGAWKTEMKMWMAPETEPMIAPGTAEFRLILDGRYVEEKYVCGFMGQPFEGRGYEGYDQVKKKYVSVWMDSMSTWPSIARGNRDESGKNVMKGTMYDVLTPGGRPYKHVSWEEDEDTMHAEMFDTLPDGTEWMVMKMTYRRKE